MRTYADPVEVRRGGGLPDGGSGDGPEQFLWRGRLWKVRAVLAHWVETGAWWQSGRARAALGADEAGPRAAAPGGVPLGELLTERELWRVEAARPRPPARAPDGDVESGVSGVFDLAFDWGDGCWTLVACTD